MKRSEKIGCTKVKISIFFTCITLIDKFVLLIAHHYAKRALDADKDNAEANKWFAITIGSLGPYVGVSEKIRNGALFKAHIDKAILLNPNDPMLHHLLGRFCFEVKKKMLLFYKKINFVIYDF